MNEVDAGREEELEEEEEEQSGGARRERVFIRHDTSKRFYLKLIYGVLLHRRQGKRWGESVQMFWCAEFWDSRWFGVRGSRASAQAEDMLNTSI